GQNQHAPIASFKTRREIEQYHSHLSESQRAAVEQILSSRDQVTALEGIAGAGKTTSLAAIREAAERDGYKVEGFAPTSRAVQKRSRGQVKEAMEKRDVQGRVHEIFDRDERMASIAHEYVKQPEGTLVVSPDNRSRTEINQAIHYAMQDAGKMPYREHEMMV